MFTLKISCYDNTCKGQKKAWYQTFITPSLIYLFKETKFPMKCSFASQIKARVRVNLIYQSSCYYITCWCTGLLIYCYWYCNQFHYQFISLNSTQLRRFFLKLFSHKTLFLLCFKLVLEPILVMFVVGPIVPPVIGPPTNVQSYRVHRCSVLHVSRCVGDQHPKWSGQVSVNKSGATLTLQARWDRRISHISRTQHVL